MVKKKLKWYPQNAPDGIHKLVLWMEKCLLYHICKCTGDEFNGDEFRVEDAGGNHYEESDH